MSTPPLGFLDERFMEHRRRSTSIAGITCAVVAILLFAWRYYVDHRWSWDLLAVVGTFLLVKYSVLAWHRLNR